MPPFQPAPSAIRTPLQKFLEDCHARLAPDLSGEVATYIPELATVAPDSLGLALATIDGHVYEVGDTEIPFTIQSISKPFVFALALDLLGAERVEEVIGVEPSGEAFNSIRLRDDNRPFNPMVNAGAITCTGLVAAALGADAFERIRLTLCRFAGRDLGLDERVFRSEQATGDRNRAIGYLLRNHGRIKGNVDRQVDTYFRQCSVLVTARDLAIMAATLANNGINPLTGKQVASPRAVTRTLAVMSTAGMYDFAGEWIYRIGVPAKSGVGGGILSTLPSQLGFGTFSPRLDSHGNSVRGIRACGAISDAFGLHMLSRRDDPTGCVVADYDFTTVPPQPGRQPHEHRILEQHAAKIRVLELTGRLSFGSADYVSRRLAPPHPMPELLILNLHRVATITDAGGRILSDMLAHELPSRTTVVIAGIESTSPIWSEIERLRTANPRTRVFATYDAAVEWAEDQIIYRHGGLSHVNREVPLAHQALLKDLADEAVAALDALGIRRVFPAGTQIADADAEATSVYFLTRGMVSLRSRAGVRLATLIPGMAFGELSLIGEPRNAHVWSETPVTCIELTSEDFTRFRQAHPSAGDRIIRNLASLLAGRIRFATARIDKLTG